MRLIPSPTPFPLYRNNQITQTTIASAIRKRFDTAPYKYDTTMNNFPKDLAPSRAFAHKFKQYHTKYPYHTPTKYVIHHVDDSEGSDDSFFSFLNPFACDSESSGEEIDDIEDDDFYGGSNELLAERKFLKLFKYKKKKKKKKIIIFKLILAFLAFIAVKFLLKKAYKFFPAILAFVRRDELYTDGEHELDRDIDFTKTSTASDDHFAQHRSLFPSSYEVEYKLNF